ncbi:MAG TPA: UDP-N-acetylmuramoyl-L-alanyl-D-glutamate--2,6-diaminopimelate ligase, partial [Thermohalobaculum sp.]|nr:UDP-N-acetylmuramoyl-L-alanyl-D-glutamate--2,6-diaminopimelate ligase [Thermohalobaculum sp.]
MARPDGEAQRTLGDLTLPCLPNAGADVDPGTRVTGIAVDSREVRDGFVFVAIPGTRLDGAEFAQFAVRQGAAAVVATPEGVEIARRDIGDLPVPFFVTERPRAWLARLAAAFWGKQPEVMVGVTGTNGKTSVAQFLRQIWEAAGHRAVAFGTLGVGGAGFDEPLGHTTPEPVTLHRLLARLACEGVTHAAMEASSHGLEQKRLDGVHLAAAGLTNITRDHMDYHPDHEAYVAAKMRLFGNVLEKGGTAVLNVDDPSFGVAREVARRRAQRVLAVGGGEGADLRSLGRALHPGGQTVRYGWEGAEHEVDLDLIGDFQADNVGLAAGLALATGITPETVFAALPGLLGVRGRMELVARRGNGAAIYVDYAHTPDALARALAALRPHCQGTLVCAFGAGGDRDRGKRPLM